MAKTKSRILSAILALVCVVGLLPTTHAFAATSATEGYAMANGSQIVYKDAACTQKYGSVNDYEGLTVLELSGGVAKINYSTANDANGKTGYLKNPSFRIEEFSKTCVGTVNSSVTVYGGPQIVSALRLGSLSSGELVSVIYSENGWYYVEYNTTAGRKRGYVQSAYINADYPSSLSGFPQSSGAIMGYSAPAQSVFGGPSDEYATIGSLSNNDWVTVYATVDNGQDVWYYIGYTASGYAKFGYVLVHS